MIIDSLDNLERYIAIHPKFEKVFTDHRKISVEM